MHNAMINYVTQLPVILYTQNNKTLYLFSFSFFARPCVMSSPPKNDGDVTLLPSLFCSIYHISRKQQGIDIIMVSLES